MQIENEMRWEGRGGEREGVGRMQIASEEK